MTKGKYKQALKEYKKVGASRATGDGLRAMFAELIPKVSAMQPKTSIVFFAHLQEFETDNDVNKEARRILSDPLLAVAIFVSGNSIK